MQVLDEQSKAYFNFINTLHSESTRELYKFCLEKFLGHYKLDLTSLLELPQESIDSRKSLNQIKEEALKDKNGNFA